MLKIRSKSSNHIYLKHVKEHDHFMYNDCIYIKIPDITLCHCPSTIFNCINIHNGLISRLEPDFPGSPVYPVDLEVDIKFK